MATVPSMGSRENTYLMGMEPAQAHPSGLPLPQLGIRLSPDRVADSAVNTRNRSREELVSDSLEGSCKLSNECTNTKLQDCKINSELQAGIEYVEYE